MFGCYCDVLIMVVMLMPSHVFTVLFVLITTFPNILCFIDTIVSN